MPLDRSPVATPITATAPALDEEDDDIRQQQATASQSLYFTGDNQQFPGQSREIHSNEFRLLKLPNFWHKQPKLWVAQLESEFSLYRIRSDDVKYSSVIRHLDEQALIAISEIIENPPYQVQATLAVVEGSPLIKLAELADKILECDNCLQVATIASSEDKETSKVSSLANLEKRIEALEVQRSRSKS